MTDRAQPGAIDSIVRNYELGDALGQFSDGWVVPADEPTASAQRSDLDETAFTAFDQTSSSSSLTVTIGPGEAFVDGWLATDSSTDVELAASTAGQTVGVSWDPDAAFDPNSDGDQDDADRVVVALEGDVSALDPFLPLWTFETDGSGVTAVTDERQIAPTVGPAALRDRSGNVIENLVGENLTLADGELQGIVGPDTRRAVNDLFIQTARQDFELGLSMLEYSDGLFEVFANPDDIDETHNVDATYGLASDDSGFVELADGETIGHVRSVEKDMDDFIPETAVISDDLRGDLPDAATVEYRIEDRNGNVESISRENIDAEVNISSIETFEVSVYADLTREDSADDPPTLDAWAVYLDGEQPDGYFQAELTDMEGADE